MTTDLAPNGASKLEQALIVGDLSSLDEQQRLVYYQRVCESLSLNPFSKPFEYLRLNGKLVLYAKRDATDQLRKLHGVSIVRLDRERQDDLYTVIATATTRDGRTDSSIGAVAISGLKGEALANAIMKCESKSKRRVTLSICGLGMLDETEVDSIPTAVVEPAPALVPASQGVMTTAPERQQAWIDDGPSTYKPLTEDQITQLYDAIEERTGDKPSDVSLALGMPIARYLLERKMSGKAFVGHWLAWRRQGVPMPGAPPSMWRDESETTGEAD